MYGGAGGGPVDPSDRNLSITLNINHGVQIMRPPPYSNRFKFIFVLVALGACKKFLFNLC